MFTLMGILLYTFLKMSVSFQFICIFIFKFILINILLPFNGAWLLNEVNEININKPQFKNNKGKLY